MTAAGLLLGLVDGQREQPGLVLVVQVAGRGGDDQVGRALLDDPAGAHLAVVAPLGDVVDDLAFRQQGPHDHGGHVAVAFLGDLAQRGRLEHDDRPVGELLVGVDQGPLRPGGDLVEVLAGEQPQRGPGGVGLPAGGCALDDQGDRLGEHLGHRGQECALDDPVLAGDAELLDGLDGLGEQVRPWTRAGGCACTPLRVCTPVLAGQAGCAGVRRFGGGTGDVSVPALPACTSSIGAAAGGDVVVEAGLAVAVVRAGAGTRRWRPWPPGSCRARAGPGRTAGLVSHVGVEREDDPAVVQRDVVPVGRAPACRRRRCCRASSTRRAARRSTARPRPRRRPSWRPR